MPGGGGLKAQGDGGVEGGGRDRGPRRKGRRAAHRLEARAQREGGGIAPERFGRRGVAEEVAICGAHDLRAHPGSRPRRLSLAATAPGVLDRVDEGETVVRGGQGDLGGGVGRGRGGRRPRVVRPAPPPTPPPDLEVPPLEEAAAAAVVVIARVRRAQAGMGGGGVAGRRGDSRGRAPRSGRPADMPSGWRRAHGAPSAGQGAPVGVARALPPPLPTTPEPCGPRAGGGRRRCARGDSTARH